MDNKKPTLPSRSASGEFAVSANGNGDPNGTKNASVRSSVREMSTIGAE